MKPNKDDLYIITGGFLVGFGLNQDLLHTIAFAVGLVMVMRFARSSHE